MGCQAGPISHSARRPDLSSGPGALWTTRPGDGVKGDGARAVGVRDGDGVRDLGNVAIVLPAAPDHGLVLEEPARGVVSVHDPENFSTHAPPLPGVAQAPSQMAQAAGPVAFCQDHQIGEPCHAVSKAVRLRQDDPEPYWAC